MENSLQRWARLTGMSARPVAPTVVDPTPHINTQIEAICILIGVPKRVFMGSERGELASSQDAGMWNGRLKQRQQRYLTPRVIVPFIDRLILLGVLPEPGEDGYRVSWPELEALSDKEQADIAKLRTEAFASYIAGNVENLILPLEYLTRIHNFDKEEVQAILEAVLEEQEEGEQRGQEAQEAAHDQQQAQVPRQQGQGQASPFAQPQQEQQGQQTAI